VISVVCKIGSDAEVTEEDSAVVVNEQVGCLYVAMNETVNMKVAALRSINEAGQMRLWHELEAFKGLSEDATDDFLVHATRPTVPHDISGAALAHEAKGDVELVAVHPAPTDTKDVRVFRKRHECCFTFEKT
jgi:ribosomal protein S12 methylthiotransferase accessory factor YcaO